MKTSLSTGVKIKNSRSWSVEAFVREEVCQNIAVTVGGKTLVNRIVLSIAISSFHFVWLIALGF